MMNSNRGLLNAVSFYTFFALLLLSAVNGAIWDDIKNKVNSISSSIKNLDKSMDNQFNGVRNSINSKVNGVTSNVNSLKSTMNNKFNYVTDKIDDMTDDIVNDINSVGSDIISIKNKLFDIDMPLIGDSFLEYNDKQQRLNNVFRSKMNNFFLNKLDALGGSKVLNSKFKQLQSKFLNFRLNGKYVQLFTTEGAKYQDIIIFYINNIEKIVNDILPIINNNFKQLNNMYKEDNTDDNNNKDSVLNEENGVLYTSPTSVKNILFEIGMLSLGSDNVYTGGYTNGNIVAKYRYLQEGAKMFGIVSNNVCDILTGCKDPLHISECIASNFCSIINSLNELIIDSLDIVLDLADMHDGITLSDEMTKNIENQNEILSLLKQR